MLYGAVVAVPIGWPFAKNATLSIVPSLSLAIASTVITAGDVNVAPSVGLESATIGGEFASTVMCTGADVVVPNNSSVATAVNV